MDDLPRAIRELIDGARSEEQKAAVIAAEEIVMEYYCDMAPLMPGILSESVPAGHIPPQEPVKKAITELNRACAEQGRSYIFDGVLGSARDRFLFASGVAGLE